MKINSFYIVPSCLLFSLLLSSFNLSAEVSTQQWYQQGQQQAERLLPINKNTAKNVILVVGDGMGVSTLTAARITAGQQAGLKYGEEYNLSFEQFPYLALIKTYNTDQQTPDSAGTITALLTGEKTKAGVLSVSEKVERGQCLSGQGQQLNTLFDFAHRQQKLTGVVSTARLTHATPAAVYAHSVERNWESDDALSAKSKTQGCQDIAQQLIDQQITTPLTIAFGGGRRHFLPESLNGRRTQGNLIEQWQATPGQYYLADAQQLAAMDVSKGRYLGLFSQSHLAYRYQRTQQTEDKQPSLLTMTQQAVRRLAQGENGYVLLIEAGRIDHAHHDNQAFKAIDETIELSQTVRWLRENTEQDETLIVVTADHSHTFTLAGYNTRGANVLAPVISNDIYGEAEEEFTQANDGLHYTSANYRNGASAMLSDKPRAEVELKQSLQPDYQQQSLVPLSYETHGGEDVALYAVGPWAHLFASTMEQHWVFHVMRHAMKTKVK